MATRSGGPKLVWLCTATLLAVARPAAAGDYMLTIADDRNAPCAERARQVQAWCEEQRKAGAVCMSEQSWPIASAARVVDDLGRYFAGEKYETPVLIVSFVNGHVDYCGGTERAAVAAGLAAIAGRADLEHERDLADILRIHASQAMLDAMRRQLAHDDLSAPSRARLSDLAVAVETALAKRRKPA